VTGILIDYTITKHDWIHSSDFIFGFYTSLSSKIKLKLINHECINII